VFLLYRDLLQGRIAMILRKSWTAATPQYFLGEIH